MVTPPNPKPDDAVREPTATAVLLALAVSLIFVAATRWPVARRTAFDFDEAGYLLMIQQADFPQHHTLFLASGKAIGLVVGNPYRGFVILDVVCSGLALAACWWFLRAIVPPRTAAAACLALGVGPVFWSYGSMAANYTAIVLVGSILLGIAARGRVAPHPLHPHVAAFALAVGTGYRPDIGLFWLPVFLLIVWRHRWVAGRAGVVAVRDPEFRLDHPHAARRGGVGQNIARPPPHSPTRPAGRTPSGSSARSTPPCATRSRGRWPWSGPWAWGCCSSRPGWSGSRGGREAPR